MSSTQNYKPNIAIPPGKTLLENLKQVGISQIELAGKTGISERYIDKVIKGQAPITSTMSLKLERVFGISHQFWNNLERNYQATVARIARFEVKMGK